MTPSDTELRELLTNARRIAVVGMSRTPGKPAFDVPRQLIARGYDVIPINPSASTIADLTALSSLALVEGAVDLVDVFRPADEAPEIARQAVRIGANALWLQLGIISERARQIASAAGMFYVEDHCLAVELRRLAIPAITSPPAREP